MLPPILGEYQTPPHDFLCQTSWQLLAVQPPRWPLYAWTPPSSRAQDRSLKVALKPSQSASQQNGPFQTKRHYQRKLWGFLQRFPHDGGVAPEIQSNTNRPRNSLVCRPSGAKKKKKMLSRDKSVRKYGLPWFFPIWRNLLTVLWFYFWIPYAIKLWPKPTLCSGIFSVQDLLPLTYSLQFYCFSSLSIIAPVIFFGGWGRG